MRARRIADDRDGVAHRKDLRAAGISKEVVRAQVAAGRWSTHGRHTVGITVGRELSLRARLWQAIWESGSGAFLDGIAALIAVGLTGFTMTAIDVTLPAACRVRETDGVKTRRRRNLGSRVTTGLRRAKPEVAAIRAAQWAVSNAQAALILCLVVQQRIVHPPRLIEALDVITRNTRRHFITQIVRDLCDGAHSLGELDFARLCRERGLPPPTRQVVRTGSGGRIYLDVAWEELGLVVEIDGGHHAKALNPVEDALRQNHITLGGDIVLRIPVIGLRLHADRFLDQVEEAIRTLTATHDGSGARVVMHEAG